jgi:hypothetical protein
MSSADGLNVSFEEQWTKACAAARKEGFDLDQLVLEASDRLETFLGRHAVIPQRSTFMWEPPTLETP